MDKARHRHVIEGVLEQLNRNPNTPFILKGGTGLMKCYGLDRFSEDIDLDAAGCTVNREAFFPEIERFCNDQGFSYRVGKNTETVKRAFVNYGDNANPLKVEVSYRRARIPDDVTEKIKGVRVYKLDAICQQKTAAYLSRDKMRDLYDVTFICSERFDELSETSLTALQNAFEYKDLSQLDYLIRTQDDPLIDKDLLTDRFLRTYDKVGLLSADEPAACARKPFVQVFSQDQAESKPQSLADACDQVRCSAGAQSASVPRFTPPGRSR